MRAHPTHTSSPQLSHSHPLAHSLILGLSPSCSGHPWASQAQHCLSSLPRQSHTWRPRSHILPTCGCSLLSPLFLKAQDTPRCAPTPSLAYLSAPLSVSSPTHIHTHSRTHGLSDMEHSPTNTLLMLTHMARVPSWVTYLEPLLLTATTTASDATQRTLGSLGTQAGSHQQEQGFPTAWAGPGWGQGPGPGCWAGRQLCGLSRDARTCADLPGRSWCQHGGLTLCPPAYRGSPCQTGDASLTFLECQGSPRRGKAGRPGLGFSL